MILEAVITVAVILLMLLFVGVPLESILNLLFIILMGVLGLSVLFVVLFFASVDISLLFFRQAEAKFLRIEDKDRFEHAVYLVGKDEYSCLFPAESVRREKIYQKDFHTLLIPRNPKRKIAYDRHSLMIILVGSLFSLTTVVLIAGFWLYIR